MPHGMPSRLIGELTFPDISKVLSESSILCLPIGSIEQHGPHLPLNTDVIFAEEFTRRIISRWGESLDIWQLPTLTISLAREHEWAPGTMSLSIHGMTAFMRDLGREIARALPARHDPQRPALVRPGAPQGFRIGGVDGVEDVDARLRGRTRWHR
jgi:creatinine amidohydrolase